MNSHEEFYMQRVVAETYYVGKGWKSKFFCPSCKREIWQHLNFLGSGKLVCNGTKTRIERRPR